jgi:hypothetical protein
LVAMSSQAGPSRPIKRSAPTSAPSRSVKANIQDQSAKGKAVVREEVDMKPVINQGDEDWAELMRNTHSKKPNDWYDKGVKTVEVHHHVIG